MALRNYVASIGLCAAVCHCEALETVTNEWSTPIDSPSDSSAAVGSDGTIYFGTWRGSLWALDQRGVCRWTFRTGIEIRSSPAIGADGTIYFGCRDHKLYAVRPDGKLQWEFKTGGWVDSSPALAADGTIYFGSWDKSFYALSPDGSRKWQFKTVGGIVSSPAVGVDGAIYFGSHDARCYALSPDGNKKWEFAAGGPIISSPALNKDQCLYFTSVDGFLYALNYDGTLRWTLRTGGMTQSSPVIGEDGTIYLGVNEHMWAITAEGKRKWEQPAPTLDVFEGSPLVLADGSVCHLARSGWVMDVESREPLAKWMFSVAQQGYASPAVGPKGTIYTPNFFTNFSAFSATVPLARTAWPKFRGNPRNTGNASDW